MTKKVIVAGHICLDITPEFPDRKVRSMGEILQPGKLLEMGAADVHTGGAVANTGLAMKILGADVTLMGKIGTDAFGDMIMNIVDSFDAGSGMIRTANASSSYTVVLAIPGIDRMFLHDPGANNTFTAADIPQEALKDTALFHFGYPPIMRKMYENDGDELIKIYQAAKEAGCATSLDLAAVDPDSPAGQADWKKILTRVLPLVDFFVPSVEELCYMLDEERFNEWQQRAAGRDITEVIDLEQDIKPLAQQCLDLGCKVVLIKCGVPGMYLKTAGEEVLRGIGPNLDFDTKRWSELEIFEKSYVPDKIRSGTGCGDTSIAAFLTAILQDRGPQTALHLAAATGASCVAAYDALSGLKSFPELEEKIAAGWPKV